MADFEKPTFVAETDATGRVTHVWLSMPGWKHARPVGRAGDAPVHAGVLAAGDVHGATRQAIGAWLAAQPNNR